MKRIVFFFCIACLTIQIHAQARKEVCVASAGGLSMALSGVDKSTMTKLSVRGTIDARDFMTMRDSMPMLSVLDLSGATIAGYSGWNGFYSDTFAADAIPQRAFCGIVSDAGSKSLRVVVLPSSVISIGDFAFRHCSGVVSVSMPSSVVSIGAGVFSGCGSLRSVNIPSSVTTIGEAAFYHCVSLKSITIPPSVSYIGNEAFEMCEKLTSFTIPPLETSLRNKLLANCSSLASVSIPPSVKTIENSVFTGCSRLSSIAIPASVTSIGECTFPDGCQVTIDQRNEQFSTIDGVVFTRGNTGLFYCPSTRTGSYVVPASVVYIGMDAFSGCWGLTSIILPPSLLSIEKSAFLGCRGLSSVVIPPSVTYIGLLAFDGCSGISSVVIPPSVVAIRDGAFPRACTLMVDTSNQHFSSSNDVLFDKTMTKLLSCPSTKKGDYSVPPSVTTINAGAFSNCEGLTSVTIAPSVTTIKASAFSGCSGLTTISVGSAVPIDLRAFSDVFGGVNKGTCTLRVPAGSKAAYETANQWKDFVNMGDGL